MTDSEKDHLFWIAYHELASVGACDAPDGCEYRRVMAEWVTAGRPDGTVAFIRRRANVSPLVD